MIELAAALRVEAEVTLSVDAPIDGSNQRATPVAGDYAMAVTARAAGD